MISMLIALSFKLVCFIDVNALDHAGFSFRMCVF